MADARRTVASRHLQMLFDVGSVVGLNDGQLLDRFVSRRDEAAFTALIERHGPMVQRVCGEVLGDHHDAQDAFQATFLVLARQAASIHRRDSLASWLYGVALRVSACARSASARRRRHERNWAVLRASQVVDDEKGRDGIGTLLHAELGRLPERFRAPVVLCYLEGRTYEEAAQLLDCPVGTIKSRLATARDRLRNRLAQLELASMAGSVGGAHGIAPATIAVPARLADMTIRAVMPGAGGGAVPVSVSKLAEGVLNIMFLNRLIAPATGLIVVAALAIGASGLAWPAKGHHVAGEARVDKPPQTNPASHDVKPQTPARDSIPTSLTGRVVNDQDRPVPGAEVRLRLFRRGFQPIMQSSEVVATWQARTDAQGRYRIEGFRWDQGPGSVYLQGDVNAPDFVEHFTFSFWGPDWADAAKGTRRSVVQIKRGVAVTGRCVGPDNKTVAGAKIKKIFAKFAE